MHRDARKFIQKVTATEVINCLEEYTNIYDNITSTNLKTGQAL